MPPISHPLKLLGARPPTVCLFCRTLPPPQPLLRSAIVSRELSISSTSIQATLPATAEDEKSVVANGLAKLAHMGLVNESRVRLAMRGLEGQDAGVRVAVLGRSGSEGRLIATLLADPLSTEKEENQWMGDLLSWSASSLQDGKKGALLIRYGPSSPITTPPGSPISLLSAPSPLLKSSALEILLAPIPSSPEDLAVITLQATETPGARIIEYPVHKTLLWAGEGAAGLSTLLNQSCTSTGPVLKTLSLPGFSTATAQQETDIKVIDLAIAEDAIAQLQSSVKNATVFEREWIQSGVDTVKQWLVSGALKSATPVAVKPAVKALVSSIISEAEALLRQEEASIIATKKALEGIQTSPTAPDDWATLSQALKEWSQTAHSELQDGLCAVFQSKPWNSLAWWKLLWAVGDVTSNSQDVLAAGFLPNSKKGLLFLAGRFSGAGYRGNGKTSSPPASVEEELEVIRKSEHPLSPVSRDKHLEWSDYLPQISSAMDYLLTNVVPLLQAAANRLLMRAFSVSTTGVAVSSLLYLSELSIYSSSSVAALGLVYSARYLQREWDKEKNHFQSTVAERGRIAIVEIERWGWERLKEGRDLGECLAAGGEGPSRIKDRRKVVGDVKRALEKL